MVSFKLGFLTSESIFFMFIFFPGLSASVGSVGQKSKHLANG